MHVSCSLCSWLGCADLDVRVGSEVEHEDVTYAGAIDESCPTRARWIGETAGRCYELIVRAPLRKLDESCVPRLQHPSVALKFDHSTAQSTKRLVLILMLIGSFPAK
jgi:hypothetical protein